MVPAEVAPVSADDSRQTLVQKQMMPPANLDAECDSQVVVLSQQIRTLEAANKEAVNRANMLEDMDSQLQDQLEKMIHQRNQCSAEKAQRDLEIQHLQAQVYLLEADVTARHNGLDSPRTPSRGPEEAAELLHQQIDSLHSENMRLHAELEIAHARLADSEPRFIHEQGVGVNDSQHASGAQSTGRAKLAASNPIQKAVLAELKSVLSTKQPSQEDIDTSDEACGQQHQTQDVDQNSHSKLGIGDEEPQHRDGVADHATDEQLAASDQQGDVESANSMQGSEAVPQAQLPQGSNKQDVMDMQTTAQNEHIDDELFSVVHPAEQDEVSSVNAGLKPSVHGYKEALLLDTPISKMQPIPDPPSADTLHLQQRLAAEKEVTKGLRITVADLTAQLAQIDPTTPPQENPPCHAAPTPVTDSSNAASVSQSQDSCNAAGSQTQAGGRAAEPTELLSRFQQSDSTAVSPGLSLQSSQQASDSTVARHNVHTQTDADDAKHTPAAHAKLSSSDVTVPSQSSSPLQLSPPESAPSSPTAALSGSNMHTPGNDYKSVTRVNDSFDASDEEAASPSLSSRSPSALSGQAPGSTAVQQQVEDGQDSADGKVDLLQRQSQQQQRLLKSLLQRAEGAEHALNNVRITLMQAEDASRALQQRSNSIELVNVVASCVAAFLIATAATVCVLH